MISERVVQMLLGFVLSVISARYLGPSNYGVINYTLAIISLFTSLSTLGLEGVVINEFVTKPQKQGEILGSAMGLRALSSLLSCGAVVIVVSALKPRESEYVLIAALQGTRLFFLAAEVIDMWFQSRLQSKVVAIMRTIAYVIVSLYRIFILATAKSIAWFAFTNSLDAALVALLFLWGYKKHNGPKVSFAWKTAVSLLKKSYRFILAGVMVAVYAQTDKVMLEHMLDTQSVGLYSISTYINGLINFVPAAVIASMRPGIIEMHKADKEQFIKKIKQLYTILIWGCWGYAAAVTLLAKPVIEILYGEEYLGAVLPTQIIVWCGAWSQMGCARDIWMICENKQKYSTTYALCGALFNVGMNAVLIPVWGMAGAAAATLLSQFLTGFVVTLLYKDTRIHNKYIIDAIAFRWN